VSISRDDSLSNAKIIYDLTKFTHLDYPNYLACIVWFSGCNMRCDFCYNSDIVFSKDGRYSYINILSFLRSRVDMLEGVVLSGGEATSHDLRDFCQEIKKLGFLIKLDTNGTNYNSVKELLDQRLLDFIALDYKAPKDKFQNISHSNKYEEFSKTLNLLIQSNTKFEVRTTLHNDLLDENDINIIINDLIKRGYKNNYYLQKFLDTGDNIANIKSSKKKFNESLLSKEINLIWR